MILSQLETFYVIAHAGSFQKASEQLFVSSTALIKQINQLEKTTGLTLFRRTNKGLELTDSGKVLYSASEQILHDYYDAIRRAKELNGQQHRIIRIGIFQINPFKNISSQFSYNAPLFANFCTHMIPISAEYKDFAEQLRTLGADVDIIPYFCGHDGLKAVCHMHCLARLPLCIAVPPQHPLASRPLLTYDDLNGHDLITINGEANTFYAEFNRTIAKHAPQVRLHIANYYDFLTINYAAHNGQLMLVGRYLKDVHPQMKLIPVDWDLTLPYGIHYAKHPSPVVQSFIQAFIDSGIDGTPENAPVIDL